jgi:hypothetical protein
MKSRNVAALGQGVDQAVAELLSELPGHGWV